MTSGIVFFLWLHRKLLQLINPAQKILGEQNYILLVSVLVGFLSGTASILMRQVESYSEKAALLIVPDDSQWMPWLVPATPAIGIFFCIFVTQVIARGHYERGLCGVIMGVERREGNIPLHKIFSHIITSGVSVGFGVSAGLEAPIALTGAAIGSNLGRALLLGRQSRILLLACGSAAAISAMFNSPVAGAFFALEIILPHSTNAIAAMIPLILASATSLVVSQQVIGPHNFPMELMQWDIKAMPYYVILGIAAGLVSAFVIHTNIFISRRMKKIGNPWLKGLAGFFCLYGAFLLFPAVRGQGYHFLSMLLSNDTLHFSAGSPIADLFQSPWSFLLLVFAMVFLKAAASVTSLESGADGGIFAPSMCIGAFLGFAVARFIHLAELPGCNNISEINFLAIGMGGVLAGVMHAPLTGIFLIAELTGGYVLLIPLMIVAALSTFFCHKFCPYNVYKTLIAEKGDNPDSKQDADALCVSYVGEIIETDYRTVLESDSLRNLLKTVMSTHHNLFPVLDENDNLSGLITLNDIRKFLLETSLYDVALVFDIMRPPQAILNSTDTLGHAIEVFEQQKVTTIPVIRNGKYAGCISKNRAFDLYRYHIEHRKELF